MNKKEFLLEQIALVDGAVSINTHVSFKPVHNPQVYFPNASMNDWNEYWKAAVELIDSKLRPGSVVIIGTSAEMSAGTAEVARVGNRLYRTMIFDAAMTLCDNDIIWLAHPVENYNLSRFFVS